MTLLADSKLDAVRDFPVNFGAPASVTPLSDITCTKANALHNPTLDCTIDYSKSPVNIKRPKVGVAWNLSKHRINGGESEWSNDVENPMHPDMEKHVMAIAAVPLRSIPTSDVKWDPEKPVHSHCEDDEDGQRMVNNNENKVDSREESWTRDSEKLAAVLAEAKEFINAFDAKYSTSTAIPPLEYFLPECKGYYQDPSSDSDILHKHTSVGEPEPKQSMKTTNSEKRAREKISAQSVTLQNLDQGPEKRTKVEDTTSNVVQDEKTFRLERDLEDNEDEVSIVSPAEWNMLQSCFRHKRNGAEARIGNTDANHEKSCFGEVTGECSNMVKSVGDEAVDCLDLCSVGKKSYKRRGGGSGCKLNENKCGEALQEHNFKDLDEYASGGEMEEDESSEKFIIDDDYAVAKYSDRSIKEVIDSKNEPKCNDNQKELINLMIVQNDHQPQRLKVMEALKLFEEQYTELLQAEMRRERKVTNAHFIAATRLKDEKMWILAEKPFGHIPGIEIGDEFRFRAELAVVGLHHQYVCGIDHVVLDGEIFATSIVDSGRYENEAKAHDVLIYSGQGGNPKVSDIIAVDQKLEKGNLALANSKEMGYPVRVTYKRKSTGRNFVYVYDGLYTVNRIWQERDQNHKLVFKFELHRMPGQPSSDQARRPLHADKPGKSRMCMEVCVLNDVSQGKENLPVRAMNGVDDDRPPPFTYVTKIVYPYWYQPIQPVGCNCIGGCSDSQPCDCVLKNGGEIPFNENGALIRAKARVHECGPLCKCPPSCMNKVSQHGPRLQLEIFKTTSRGWGVRSRNYISSGSFICEYVGELLRDKEADQRIGDDEYLFDICDSADDEEAQGEVHGSLGSKTSADGFAIDAAMLGNIGRFINHSCSPNLFAQEVLYDHDDKRMPHIMFFAAKNIPPLHELFYDYNYKMDRICDANGNIKTKKCYCGARKCTGRMY